MNLDIFIHENHSYPQSLSVHGNLRANNKSDLVSCLDDFTTPVSEPPNVDAIISDCPAVVHLQDPGTVRTFSDYAVRVFLPYIDRKVQPHQTQRVDLVGVIHTFLTVLSRQRGRRGEREYGGGCSAKRTFQTTGYLRVDTNQVELFELPTNEVMNISYAKRAYMHLARDVWYARINMHNIIPTISAHALRAIKKIFRSWHVISQALY